MNKPTFFEGVMVALLASIVVSACAMIAINVLLSPALLHIIIAIVSAAYIVYLMIRSRERLGRLTIFTIWFAATILSAIFFHTLEIFVLGQLAMIWVVRSLYYHNSVLTALADLGLMALSTAVAIWAWLNTQSLFLSTWCFFLTQALFVYLPKQWNPTKANKSVPSSDDRFEHAYLAADKAVHQLFLNQPKS